jgi:hypothetical protein
MLVAVTGKLMVFLGVRWVLRETWEREWISEYWGERRTSLNVRARGNDDTRISIAGYNRSHEMEFERY